MQQAEGQSTFSGFDRESREYTGYRPPSKAMMNLPFEEERELLFSVAFSICYFLREGLICVQHYLNLKLVSFVCARGV